MTEFTIRKDIPPYLQYIKENFTDFDLDIRVIKLRDENKKLKEELNRLKNKYALLNYVREIK